MDNFTDKGLRLLVCMDIAINLAIGFWLSWHEVVRLFKRIVSSEG